MQDKATVFGEEHPVYTNVASPEKERIVYGIKDPRFLNAPMRSKFPVRYLQRNYQGAKTVRIVRRKGKATSAPPVLEFQVTGGK